MRREFAQIGVRIIPHALWPLLRRAAADLEGFAHSAAAGETTAQEVQHRHLTHLKYRLEALLQILAQIICPQLQFIAFELPIGSSPC